MDTYTLPTNKQKKRATVVAGAVLFISNVLFLIYDRPQFSLFRYAVYFGIILFGSLMIYSIIRLFDNKSFIINEKDIRNTVGYNNWFVPWKSITGIRSADEVILLDVNHPELYLPVLSGFRQKMQDYCIGKFDTPLIIDPRSVQGKARRTGTFTVYIPGRKP